MSSIDLFFFTDPTSTEISTLSLHDALPILLHPCFFTVSFVPTKTGTRTGTLIVNDNSLDSPHIIQLSSELSLDRKSTRLNSSHVEISYAVFCLKKKK